MKYDLKNDPSQLYLIPTNRLDTTFSAEIVKIYTTHDGCKYTYESGIGVQQVSNGAQARIVPYTKLTAAILTANERIVIIGDRSYVK